MTERYDQTEAFLYSIIGPVLQDFKRIASDANLPPEEQLYNVDLPEHGLADLPLDELQSLVARTANVYGRLSDFTARASAQAKLAKGVYDFKRKRTVGTGRNDSERQADVMGQCEEESEALRIIESILVYGEHKADAARLKSESARKIIDKVEAMNIAQIREDRGVFRDRDFR